MMTCDAIVRLVREMDEVADKISKAEKALDDYGNESLPMSGHAAELLKNRLLQ